MENEVELKESALVIYSRVSTLKVLNNDDYLMAGESLKRIKDIKTQIEAYFEPLVSKANALHKELTNKRADALKLVLESDKIVRAEISRYATEQERLRQIEQRKLEEKAREDARKEQERLLKLAEKAEVKGNDEKAGDLLERAEAVYAEPVFAIPTVNKTTKLESGSISNVKDIEVSIVLRKEFLRYAIDNLPEAIIDINMTALKRFVKATGTKTIIGVKITDIFTPKVR
ncbi:MAG: hypothetical protein ACYC97_05595 [Metallibacterium sp.]